MCRNWISMMSVTETRTRWGVPAETFQELGELFAAAQALLQKSMDEAQRTHVVTVEMQAAFKALTSAMRDMRDRYFKLPPLTEAEWAGLGFRQKDAHPTPFRPPTAPPWPPSVIPAAPTP
jgi:hypothetical protein